MSYDFTRLREKVDAVYAAVEGGETFPTFNSRMISLLDEFVIAVDSCPKRKLRDGLREYNCQLTDLQRRTGMDYGETSVMRLPKKEVRRR